MWKSNSFAKVLLFLRFLPSGVGKISSTTEVPDKSLQKFSWLLLLVFVSRMTILLSESQPKMFHLRVITATTPDLVLIPIPSKKKKSELFDEKWGEGSYREKETEIDATYDSGIGNFFLLLFFVLFQEIIEQILECCIGRLHWFFLWKSFDHTRRRQNEGRFVCHLRLQVTQRNNHLSFQIFFMPIQNLKFRRTQSFRSRSNTSRRNKKFF